MQQESEQRQEEQRIYRCINNNNNNDPSPCVWDSENAIPVSKYQLGFRYCRYCTVWYKTEEFWCQECGRRLRLSPRKCKAKWYRQYRNKTRVY